MNNPRTAAIPLQGLVSRTGSFPLPIALRLLLKYRNRSARRQPIILDPFCGKGTTLLAARMLGLPVYGMDVAPEAVICTMAKMVDVTLDSVSNYIKGLRISQRSLRAVPASVKAYFHPVTLRAILSVRDQLLRDTRAGSKQTRVNATFVLAALLGILHGKSNHSLSLPSAHAYSMAPAYALRYARKHRLKAPIRDVKKCLLIKVARCLRVPPPPRVKFQVRRGSALHCSRVFSGLRGKVDLILTSPPYLNAQTYAKDNWLRLWLLGYDHKHLQKHYIETGSVQRYAELMQKVFREFRSMLRPGGRLVCIAGDIRLRGRRRKQHSRSTFRTGSFLGSIITSDSLGLIVERQERHSIPSNSRYFHALSGSKGHSKHALTERVLVAARPK